MKKHNFLICMLIIVLFGLIGFCYISDNTYNFLLNLAYGLMSSLFGAIVVLAFLDTYYKFRKEQALKNFNINLKLKTYSNFILINYHIPLNKHRNYDEKEKNNAIFILESLNSLDCYTSVDCILKNLENLLKCLSKLCSEKELKKVSKGL